MGGGANLDCWSVCLTEGIGGQAAVASEVLGSSLARDGVLHALPAAGPNLSPE
jgi:hypothetical protein